MATFGQLMATVHDTQRAYHVQMQRTNAAANLLVTATTRTERRLIASLNVEKAKEAQLKEAARQASLALINADVEEQVK